MFYWLHQVWLFVVASALIQDTVRLLVVTKCLSCLDTVNHKFSITHSASKWTSSKTDAFCTEQLYTSCCMHWDFITCRVHQTETIMWQSTGRTYKQVMSVFAHITHILNMHQFPVHTEHTKYYIHCTPMSLLCKAAMAVQATSWYCRKVLDTIWNQIRIQFNYINKIQFLLSSFIPPWNQSALRTQPHHFDSPICLVTITISPILK